ncbi:DUF21 domain-containing protein At5g52790 (CBS domain-containing protein CBSDUF5) [Durusdinium trenchii]
MALLCVVGAALAAGLTMGLVSIDPMEMEIIVKTEDKDMVEASAKQKLKKDQAAAERILPLIHDHHLLLVTLLLMNSIANEALPLFLDQIVPSWLAVVLSVSLVLMFGEIIPSAVFTGSEQLTMASRFAGLVSAFMFVLTPISWPIAKLLDRVLGADHKGRYNFAELRAIVSMHAGLRMGSDEEDQVVFKSHDDKELGIIFSLQPHSFTSESVVMFSETSEIPAKSTKLKVGQMYYASPCEPWSVDEASGPDMAFRLYSHRERNPDDLIIFKSGELTSGVFKLQERDEIKIMHGVMNLTHMTAQEALVPLRSAHMLDADAVINHDTLREIDSFGHSRIPVYRKHKHNVRGFILVKKLIMLTPEQLNGSLTFGDLHLFRMTLVHPGMLMLDLLNKFQDEKCHLGLVTSNPEAVEEAWAQHQEVPPDVHMMGLITLEDVIEKLIQENIEDESDILEKSGRSTKSLPLGSGVSPRKLGMDAKGSPRLLPAPAPTSNTLKAPLLAKRASEPPLNRQEPVERQVEIPDVGTESDLQRRRLQLMKTTAQPENVP